MIRSFCLAASAVAILAAPTIASAADDGGPFNDFQKICWATAGDYNGAVSAADADGWKDAQIISDTPAGVSITGKAARQKASGPATLTLLIMQGLQHTKAGDYQTVICKLSSDKPIGGMIAEGKSWVGSAPDNNPPDPTFAVYYVKNGPGAPAHVGTSGVQTAMDSTGSFAVLKFQSDSDSGTFVYQVYAKPKG